MSIKGMDKVRIIHIEHKSGSVEPVQYIELRPHPHPIYIHI